MPVNIIANGENENGGSRSCRRRYKAYRKRRYSKYGKRRRTRRSKKSRRSSRKESGLFYTSSKLRRKETQKIVRHLQRIMGANAYVLGVEDADAVATFANTPSLDSYLKAKAYFAKHPRRISRAALGAVEDTNETAEDGARDLAYGAIAYLMKSFAKVGIHPDVDVPGMATARVQEFGNEMDVQVVERIRAMKRSFAAANAAIVTPS